MRGKRGIQLLNKLSNSLQFQIVEASGINNLELSALTNCLAELKGLLEKTKAKNWLDNLIFGKEDPVAGAIEAEIQKVEKLSKVFRKGEFKTAPAIANWFFDASFLKNKPSNCSAPSLLTPKSVLDRLLKPRKGPLKVRGTLN